MLEAPRTTIPAAELVPPTTIYDWRWMVRSLFRQLWLVLLIPTLCGLVAVAHVQLRPSFYTASTVLEISNIRLSPGDNDPFFVEALFDPTFLETQIQIIASQPIARAVVGELGQGEPAEQEALRQFRDRLRVDRVGQSNLVQISFTDMSSQHAADIANAVATAYVEKLRSDRDRSALSANSWLRERLRGVGAQAQVVSIASPPLYKSDTRGILIIAGALVAGGVGGALFALILSFLDRRMRDPEQILAASGIECLGIVPFLDTKGHKKPEETTNAPFSMLSASPILHDIDRGRGTPLWHAVRSASVVGVSPSVRAKRVAITSTLTGEGKTTIAANYALLAAKAGRSVLLVDTQAYDPKLTRLLTPRAGLGLTDFLSASKPQLSRYVLNDPRTGVHFLPFGNVAAGDESRHMLWTYGMDKLFDQARDYDLVVLDMPPLVATGDMRAAAQFVDGILLVVEWNRVTDSKLSAALTMAGPVRELLMGAIFNKASLRPTERWLSPALGIVSQQLRLARKRP